MSMHFVLVVYFLYGLNQRQSYNKAAQLIRQNKKPVLFIHLASVMLNYNGGMASTCAGHQYIHISICKHCGHVNSVHHWPLLFCFILSRNISDISEKTQHHSI